MKLKDCKLGERILVYVTPDGTFSNYPTEHKYPAIVYAHSRVMGSSVIVLAWSWPEDDFVPGNAGHRSPYYRDEQDFKYCCPVEKDHFTHSLIVEGPVVECEYPAPVQSIDPPPQTVPSPTLIPSNPPEDRVACKRAYYGIDCDCGCCPGKRK